LGLHDDSLLNSIIVCLGSIDVVHQTGVYTSWNYFEITA